MKTKILFNLGGTVYSSFIAFVFVPIFIKNLGAEAYGLIAVFASVQTILAILDGGLSTTLNREFARLNNIEGSAQVMRNTLKSIEFVYFLLSLLITLIALFLSPYIAAHWIKPKSLSISIITDSFLILSISLFFQFPQGLYSGGFMGIQKQIHLNILRVVFATIKNLGGVLLVIFYTKNIVYFFLWMLIVSIIQLVTYRFSLYRLLNNINNVRAIIDIKILKNLKNFTLGLTTITITSILFSQFDKVLLSKILTLDQFGYYSISTTIGLIIFQIIGPVSQTYFPKYSELIALNEDRKLKYYFHQGAQLMTILVLPASLILFFFSRELIWIWSLNKVLVENTWIVVSIFSLGSAFNGLINIHYQLFLSYGWVKAPVYQNIIFLIFSIPLVLILTYYFGAKGAAFSWLATNFLSFIISPLVFHKKYLCDEYFNWLFKDTLKPMIILVLQILLFKYISTNFFIIENRWGKLVFLMFLGLFVSLTTYIFLFKKKHEQL